MKFRVPPQWPQPPDGWIPDPGWRPDAGWSAPPQGWNFWVNDYDVPIEGPVGLYGGRIQRLRWTRVALAAGAAFLLLFVGVGIGGSGSAQGSAAGLASLPTHTESITVTATQSPSTVTVTRPPETVTAPAETVTATSTVTVEAAPAAGASDDGFGLLGSTEDEESTSVYYENCTAARNAGAAPVRVGEPGYGSHLDRDGDGVGCE